MDPWPWLWTRGAFKAIQLVAPARSSRSFCRRNTVRLLFLFLSVADLLDRPNRSNFAHGKEVAPQVRKETHRSRQGVRGQAAEGFPQTVRNSRHGGAKEHPR